MWARPHFSSHDLLTECRRVDSPASSVDACEITVGRITRPNLL
ncbi:hypothetical protein RSSM_06130 [Rhodopirellula sallentina SM41]|uniref:Uncharacterized protein n=1 Tax=Rhodopirellula sallentina SM41 TaxID=1263870 RepID=M5U8W8_9BACT|nr:hypothetical protein RSSM_06130 [Rhodopirellula sallentina SM41]